MFKGREPTEKELHLVLCLRALAFLQQGAVVETFKKLKAEFTENQELMNEFEEKYIAGDQFGWWNQSHGKLLQSEFVVKASISHELFKRDVAGKGINVDGDNF